MTPTIRLNQITSHLTSNMSNITNTKNELLDDYIFFGYDTVNRVSFLREDNVFIRAALTHPSTKITVFWNDAPIGIIDETSTELYYSNYFELKSHVDQWLNYNDEHDIRINDLRFTFLGIDERSDVFQYKKYKGLAYFGVDITNHPTLQDHFKLKFSKDEDKTGVKLLKNRKDVFNLSNFDSSIYSHAKMYLDWLRRNKFCAGCGKPTIAISAGTKLRCSSNKETDGCPVRTASVSNISFPRTDSVIITAITNPSYSKILLGRGKRFPVPMYSCIAGFMEPSETIEVASLREVWEETGVHATELKIIKSQPWPYPANLMIGCVAIVDFNGINEVIDLGHDPELLDAQWFDVEDIRQMLDTPGLKSKDGSWNLPPPNSIAYHLIAHVVKVHNSQK